MRITGLKKKLISLIVAVIMTVSGMYVENINIDSSFAYEDTANQNFTQAVHLSRPSESCTEELLGNRETGRIAAGYRRLTVMLKKLHYHWQQYCLKIWQEIAGISIYGS